MFLTVDIRSQLKMGLFPGMVRFNGTFNFCAIFWTGQTKL